MPMFGPMRVMCLLLTAVAIQGAWLDVDHTLRDLQLLEEKAARGIFQSFVDHHGPQYAADPQEYERRFSVFWDNMKFVAAHNQQRRSFHVALNHLTDLTQEEVHAQRTGLQPPRRTQPQSSAAASSAVLSLSAEEARALEEARTEMQHPLPGPTDEIKARFDPFPRATPGHAECTYRLRDVKPPPEVDWRKHGVVAPVKDQEGCGSCWAYATTSAAESLYAIKTGKLTVMSEQAPNDCNWMSNPCVGGNMEEGYKWLTANGLVSLEAYPYNEGKKWQACNRTAWYSMEKYVIDTYEMIPPGEGNLMKAVAKQPVSVGVDANHKEFIFYKGGIFDHQPCNDTEELLTHAITAVGYGQEDGVGFWIVRNQWNTNWGEEGYMRMAMGVGPVGSDVGICGIARLASRPVMDGSEDFHLFSHLPTWAEEAREQVAQNMDDQSPTSVASALLRQAARLPAKLVGAGRKMLG